MTRAVKGVSRPSNHLYYLYFHSISAIEAGVGGKYLPALNCHSPCWMPTVAQASVIPCMWIAVACTASVTRELLPLKLLRLGARGKEAAVVRTDDGRLLGGSSITTDFDRVFLASGGLDRLRAGLTASALAEIDAEGLRAGAPVARPGKVACIGLNYLDHAETGAAFPSRPVVL